MDTCDCSNFYYDLYEKICTDCGRIYPINDESVNFDEIYKPSIVTKPSLSSKVINIAYLYTDILDDELFKNISYIINDTIYKGNNKKSIILFLIFSDHCIKKRYNEIFKFITEYNHELFLKSKKTYKKLLENECIKINYITTYDIIYYIMHYGEKLAIDHNYILQCIEMLDALNALSADLKKCNTHTIAISILYKNSDIYKTKLSKCISQPTLKKILKLI